MSNEQHFGNRPWVVVALYVAVILPHSQVRRLAQLATITIASAVIGALLRGPAECIAVRNGAV
jgi:hypothetical protein